ncbi:MAG: hypothetical protein LUD51_02250 [Clostridia bacterium]|nr:hypothetical protein [Clostridia bacterium]
MNFVLRIVFTLLAVASAACCIFIFIYFSWWGFIPLGGVIIFGGLMYFFSRRDKKDEEVETEQNRKGDFITGPVHKKTPEEIAAEQAEISAHTAEDTVTKQNGKK